jgi:hypothetical protein
MFMTTCAAVGKNRESILLAIALQVWESSMARALLYVLAPDVA